MSFIDYDIKIEVTQEQSRKVQRICFENGIGWIGGGERIFILSKDEEVLDSVILTLKDKLD